MASIETTKVSLRFSGDDLDPGELTERLGAVPTSAAVKGQALPSASGRERIARTGRWQLRVQPAIPNEEFQDQVVRLFSQLTEDLDTWRELSARFGGNLFVGLFLGSSNEGAVIEPEAVQAIAERGLELGLDIYSSSEE